MEVWSVNFIIFGKESITLNAFREPSRPTSEHRLHTAATNTAATTWNLRIVDTHRLFTHHLSLFYNGIYY